MTRPGKLFRRRREDVERLMEAVRVTHAELAARLRIEERELEAGELS